LPVANWRFKAQKFVQNFIQNFMNNAKYAYTRCRVGAGKFANGLSNYGIYSLFFFDAGESG